MLARVEAQSDHIKTTTEPACLYVGQVMHARLKPFIHRFTYSVFNLLIDIDRLGEADRLSGFFNVNKRGLVSFHEKDHGGETAAGLSTYIRSLLKDHARKDKAAADQLSAIDRIQLLCYPRILGYVFNPISIYYCSSHGDLVAMVYEVRNTFGGKHIYVEPVRDGQRSVAGIKQACDKLLHVSPFIEMTMRYNFSLSEPGEILTFRILECDAEGPLLSATLKANRKKLNTSSLLKRLVTIPFLTLKVMAGIHFEALKLWVKGAKFIPNPHKR